MLFHSDVHVCTGAVTVAVSISITPRAILACSLMLLGNTVHVLFQQLLLVFRSL